jgi:hypothetical protein
MSVIEKSLAKVGLSMEADKLPKGSRTVKVFQRLIAAMRAAEAEVQEALSSAHHQLNEALRKILDLQAENHKLRAELQRLKVKEQLDAMEALTTADRTLLLECAQA